MATETLKEFRKKAADDAPAERAGMRDRAVRPAHQAVTEKLEGPHPDPQDQEGHRPDQDDPPRDARLEQTARTKADRQ